MTKIAIKGPASGTGSYTLNAPETPDTLDFELPLVGTHLASAQADGMPLGPGGDPVVESGSNSDGIWTRWADGTQVCYGAYVGGENISATFPRSFTDPARIVVSPEENVGTARIAYLKSKTLSGFVFRSSNHDNTTVSPFVYYNAIGRWK